MEWALGQHQRHEHPERRNEIRMKKVNKSHKLGHVCKILTEQELQMLDELEVKFRNEKFIAKAISEVSVTKT